MLAAVLMSSVSFGQQFLTKKGNSLAKNNDHQKVTSLHQISSKSSKTVHWSSDFSNAADWIISHAPTADDLDWVIGTGVPAGTFAIPGIESTTAANGFALYDSDLLDGTNQIAYLTTANSIDLSTVPVVVIKFESFYRKYKDTIYVSVSNNNTDWIDFEVHADYAQNQMDDTNPTTEEIDISSVAGSQSTVWIRFKFVNLPPSNDGGYAWMVDDASISTDDPVDIELVSINTITPTAIGFIDITGTVENNGSDVITSYDVTYTIDGGAASAVYSVTGANILNGATADFTHDVQADLTTPDTYTVEVTISNVNGGTEPDLTNNVLSKDITTVSQFIQKKVLHEVLTSSTCAPCAVANPVIDGVVFENNEDKSTLIKYQVSWPGAGDPYHNQESANRVSYYGTSGVPDFWVDGTNNENGVNYSQAKLDAYSNASANVAISGTASLTGTTMSVDIDYEAFADISGTLVAQVAVIETKTFNNVGTNGETEFHNVMMKFMPGTAGNAFVDFASGDVQNVTLSTDLAGTNIEWISNLRVVAWLQDDVTHEVFQSGYIPVANIDNPDAGVTAITTVNSACGLPASNDITITIHNAGSDITDFEVGYTVNGTDGQTATYVGTIAMGESADFTFANPEDFSAVGNYEIVAFTNVVGDTWTPNDSITKLVANLAPAAIPYAETFEGDFQGWTILDVGNDTRTWALFDGPLAGHGDETAFFAWFHPTQPADDYLFSTCLDLAEGIDYDLNFWYRCQGAQGIIYPEKMKVLIGNAQTVAAMTDTIVDLGEFDNMTYTLSTTTFNVAETGTYYIGFHCYSDADMFVCMLDDISIDIHVGIPEAVNNTFNIYPNPSSTGLFTVEGVENARIMVYNVIGEVVYTEANAAAITTIDLSSYNAGNYIVKVISNHEVSIQKIVITK